jgi:hypothetical protein
MKYMSCKVHCEENIKITKGKLWKISFLARKRFKLFQHHNQHHHYMYYSWDYLTKAFVLVISLALCLPKTQRRKLK